MTGVRWSGREDRREVNAGWAGAFSHDFAGVHMTKVIPPMRGVKSDVVLGTRGQRGISRISSDVGRNHRPGLCTIKPNGHGRRERAGIIKARNGNRQEVRRGRAHWRATRGTKLSAYLPCTFRLHAIARRLAMPGHCRSRHDHVVPIGPARPTLAITAVTQGHGKRRSATLVPNLSAETPPLM